MIMRKNPPKKFQLVMNDDFWVLLEDLKERTNLPTYSDVFKEGVIALDWIVTQQEQGKQIVAQRRNPKADDTMWSLVRGTGGRHW
jgi:hypothetical protein